MDSDNSLVQIAITGTLSRPRHEFVLLLESRTNARFSEHVTYQTNYLVASRFDTNKARRAAKLGVRVITEHDMLSFIEHGHFPQTPLPTKPPSNWHPIDLDALEYEIIERFPEPRIYYLKYKDHSGNESERFLLAMERVRGGTHEYVAGYDQEHYKTFRIDRIESIEDLGPIEKSENSQ